MKHVCVLGLGYIGLPTASVLASNGFQVTGVDISDRIVETVNRGDIHIEEPGLRILVQAAIQSGNLCAAKEPGPADIYIVAVPTPLTLDKRADMTYVERATMSIVPHLVKGNLVILESTSPPGTCTDLLKPILETSGLAVGSDLLLAHCPERVLPGRILKELIENDRIIGGFDQASARAARTLYEAFVEGEVFLTDATTAEVVKLLENTYRDVNIALANEAALLCEEYGVDFWEAARFANRHPRVHLHSAGPGVGGHCISIDPWFLVERKPELAQLIQLARKRNDGMPAHVTATIQRLLNESGGTRVAALGLAYKGNVDDIRESPAVRIVELLREGGVEVSVYDPYVPGVTGSAPDAAACVQGSDCIAILTDHEEFQSLDPVLLAPLMRNATVFDTRNILDRAAWRAVGFRVEVIGCGKG